MKGAAPCLPLLTWKRNPRSSSEAQVRGSAPPSYFKSASLVQANERRLGLQTVWEGLISSPLYKGHSLYGHRAGGNSRSSWASTTTLSAFPATFRWELPFVPWYHLLSRRLSFAFNPCDQLTPNAHPQLCPCPNLLQPEEPQRVGLYLQVALNNSDGDWPVHQGVGGQQHP